MSDSAASASAQRGLEFGARGGAGVQCAELVDRDAEPLS